MRIELGLEHPDLGLVKFPLIVHQLLSAALQGGYHIVEPQGQISQLIVPTAGNLHVQVILLDLADGATQQGDGTEHLAGEVQAHNDGHRHADETAEGTDGTLGINVPANKRKVGFLFQNYALWPNMTVYQNIAFGLSNIREPLPKTDFEAKNAARLAEILKTPGEVVKVVEDCRDKKGKIDEKKAYIKLIDTFRCG